MAWQVKTRYTGKPSTDSVLKSDDGTKGTEVQNLFNQYLADKKILNQERASIDENTKVDTIVFIDEATYTEYRNALISIIGNDENQFSSHSVEVIEQKEVIWG
tara:strand:- start:185 stop:493 length:309 start_codon:yes stop_codon:yes gene_type:complete